MRDHYYGIGKTAAFILNHTPEGENAEVISELNATLLKMGCGHIEIKEHVDPSHNAYYPVMVINFNSKAAEGYNRRGAGRNKKRCDGGLFYVSEIKKMLETKTADEVAKDLGISRSTLFRRLKDKDDNRYF